MSRKTGRTFDFDPAFDAYRRQMPTVPMIRTTSLCPPPSMPNMQPIKMSRGMVKRQSNAVADDGPH